MTDAHIPTPDDDPAPAINPQPTLVNWQVSLVYETTGITPTVRPLPEDAEGAIPVVLIPGPITWAIQPVPNPQAVSLLLLCIVSGSGLFGVYLLDDDARKFAAQIRTAMAEEPNPDVERPEGAAELVSISFYNPTGLHGFLSTRDDATDLADGLDAAAANSTKLYVPSPKQLIQIAQSPGSTVVPFDPRGNGSRH